MKNELFNELTNLSDNTRTHLLCRLFGMFESEESVTSEEFFSIIKLFASYEKARFLTCCECGNKINKTKPYGNNDPYFYCNDCMNKDY